MKKFCTKRNEEVALDEVNGMLACPHGLEVQCSEAKCRYCLGVRTRVELYGESQDRYPDYTVEKNSVLADKGTAKVCDVCSGVTYKDSSSLLSAESVLASSRYLDYLIDMWVGQGHVPSAMAAGSQRYSLYPAVREQVRKQTGDTPWLICGNCARLFPMGLNDKAGSRDRAAKFWADQTTRGITISSMPESVASTPAWSTTSAASPAVTAYPKTIRISPALQKIAIGNIGYGLFRLASFIYRAIIVPSRLHFVQDTSLLLLNTIIFALPVNLLFIASGILLLKNKESGRKVSIVASVIALGFVFLNLAMGRMLFFKYFNWYSALGIIYPVIALGFSLKKNSTA